ncbi:MAG: SufD family Fe-S cluster assembly protein [Cohaesibacteraceae bacterium]
MSESIADRAGELSGTEETILREVGYDAPASRSATAVLIDHDLRVASSQIDGVEIMPIQEALMRYDWVQNLMFNMIAPDENELLRQSVELLDDPIGHFIYVHDGTKVPHPIQTFTVMERPQGRQFTHNITVIGKDAEVDMISGAAVPGNVHAGHHVSIEETYIRDGARCRGVSIERWGSNMLVDSFSRSEVGAGAEVVSNQIMLAALRRHLSDSKTYIGADASSNEQAIIFAPQGTKRTFELEVFLTAEGARSEHLARMVSAGGEIINNNLLVGQAPGTNGFLGCDGLMLSSEGEIVATPSLKAASHESMLSHEASVGMIDKDKLAYLMASGLSEDRARDLIVQGFLNLNDVYIPDEMRAQVTDMIAAAQSGGM